MKTHVFKYSQVIKTDRGNAVTLFTEKSSSTLQDIINISLKEEQEGGIIFKYKIGEIETPEFRTSLNTLIENKGGKSLEDNVFDSCWNAMCVVEPEELAKLYELQQEHNFGLHIIGGANELQHDFIQNKIKKAPSAPEISYTLSFKEHTLDPDILKKHAEEEILSSNSEAVWHIDSQHGYQQNALDLLGEFYNSDPGNST